MADEINLKKPIRKIMNKLEQTAVTMYNEIIEKLNPILEKYDGLASFLSITQLYLNTLRQAFTNNEYAKEQSPDFHKQSVKIELSILELMQIMFPNQDNIIKVDFKEKKIQ
jgi:hypothetical protein